MGEEEEKNWTLELLDQEEWREALADLIDGRETLTYSELLSLAPEIKEDGELFSVVVEILDQIGVTVADPIQQAEASQESAPRQALDWDSLQPEDLLDFYLAELSQEALLTHAQEIELAQQIELGQQAAMALAETGYTAGEYARLADRVEAGKAARARLGSANTRLVVSIAKRYRGYGIPFPDLIQNGNVGLMRAIDHYDHKTGYRFSTYATWWIRQAVTRSLSNQGRVIRIPVHTGTRIRKMNQVAQRLEMEHGMRPTSDDIATEMGESPQKIRQLMQWVGDAVSLDRPLGEDRDIDLQDLIMDENAPQPDEVTDMRLLDETLRLLMGGLTVREAKILRMRYGLGGAQTHTLAEIGKKLSLSRERIRQIEREALAKLRLVASDHRLEHFL